jgi:hypothetical protein
MGENSGGKSYKRKMDGNGDIIPNKICSKFTRNNRSLFKDYNHIYSDNNLKEYPVLLSCSPSTDGITPKIDLLKINRTLKSIKGVGYIKPIGLSLLKIVFSNKSDANNFIMDTDLLKTHGWLARIPFDSLESLGIIRAPPELSEEELLESLSSGSEIIGVKRFMRKTENDLVPTPTVLITFLGSSHPDHVTYDCIWFEVKDYVKPLRQCYTCYKFGHGKGSCKAKQICSICAGQHHFKECTNDLKKCVNCNGTDHLAVSSKCPIKKAKIEEVKNQINGKSSFASVSAKSAFPPLKPPGPPAGPRRRAILSDILNSDELITAITKTVIDILHKKDGKSDANSPVCSRVIKELLITNFTSK